MVAPVNFIDESIQYLKSPLNYTGGKYKLLNQIKPMFPSKIDTFVDLFAGGCNVAINVQAKNIIANDISPYIIELYNYFQKNTIATIESDIDKIILKYALSNSSKYGYEHYNTNSKDGLASYNKEKYLRLRADYNKNPSPVKFYTMLIYAFNNQIRFNKKGEFNLPVNKRDFTLNMRKNLKLFVERIKELNINFMAKDFTEIDIPDNSFVYVDPPYLATTASYNENGGWNDENEIRLLKYLDGLNNKGVKFALSNVLQSKGVKNDILIKWCKDKRYTINYLNYSYSNCSYQTKNRDKNSTMEVLITNYNPSINGLTSSEYHLEPQSLSLAKSS
jgi:DNA adenine methylase Dam